MPRGPEALFLCALATWGIAGPACAQAVQSPLDGSRTEGPRPYITTSRPAPGPTLCGQAICGAWALVPVFQRLDALEATGQGRVHILQLGDSHTAGDQITGRVRNRLQARFGRGGRGLIPAGVPWAGYAPRQLSLEASGLEYRTASPAPGLAGGWSLWGERSRLVLLLDPETPLSALGVCGRAGPEQGRLIIVPDGGMIDRVDFAANAPVPLCTDVTLEGAMGLTLVAEGALVLDSLSLWSGDGVVLSNLGVVGSTLRDLEGRDAAVAEAQLSAASADLVVLAYGVNEGFDDGLDLAAYERALRGRIAWLRAVAPGAAILVMSAPDGLRRVAATDGLRPWTLSCGVQGERETPPSLALVRDVQRRVAEDLGVALWDWYGRMGGACSAERLAEGRPGGDEPLMRGDRVHFTASGAEWIGDLFADDLMSAYDDWRAGRADGAD